MERTKDNLLYDPDAFKLNPNSNEYKEYLNTLASEGMFDVHTTKLNVEKAKKIDGRYVYVPKNIMYKFTKSIVKVLLRLIGPIINKFAFNIKVKGRKNIKGIKSAISISNHVHYLDFLMNYQAVKKKNFYVLAANHNMKKGLVGYIFKAGGMLPLSPSIDANVNLNRTISKILNDGGFVHIYAESALWFRYERSRPLKIGAFKMAVQNNVPVVPIVILFRQKGKLEFYRRKKTVTVDIGKPIYPPSEGTVKERAEAMREECQKCYNDTVCTFYGYDKDTYSIYKNPEEKAG